ncbi:MAG: hypothetical protein MUE39_03160 [Gammaproteobacteria bacterium]|jgi:hypothetical protein|nr:hypothetical protein [Gammaproteobacteria bacterium]
MRFLRWLALLAGLPTLIACATTPPPDAAAPATESPAEWELAQWQSPRFDVLRSRMPVQGRDVTFDMLNSPARVTRAEQAALGEWAEITLTAQRRALDDAAAVEPPEVIALGEAARSRHTSNLLALHNGVLSWGEFNRRTLTIDAEYRNALANLRLVR